MARSVKRPGYREAVRWIAANDDTSELVDRPDLAPVTVVLVADLFDKETETVAADVVREVARRATSRHFAHHQEADR